MSPDTARPDAARLDPVLRRIDAGLGAATDRLFDLLRIPSISTDPEHAADCRRAADLLVSDLRAIGCEASRRDTPGRPMVVAHIGEGAPHLLFYAHYDVQPADPLELWDRDPFDPLLDEEGEDAVIRARGASDDKGQMMTFVEALRAWIETDGGAPCRITILLEGEEESGSPSLVPFLRENAEELRADLALICDTGMFDRDTPRHHDAAARPPGRGGSRSPALRGTSIRAPTGVPRPTPRACSPASSRRCTTRRAA